MEVGGGEGRVGDGTGDENCSGTSEGALEIAKNGEDAHTWGDTQNLMIMSITSTKSHFLIQTALFQSANWGTTFQVLEIPTRPPTRSEDAQQCFSKILIARPGGHADNKAFHAPISAPIPSFCIF